MLFRSGQNQNQLIIFFAAKHGEVLYSHQKQDWELTVAQIRSEERRVGKECWPYGHVLVKTLLMCCRRGDNHMGFDLGHT